MVDNRLDSEGNVESSLDKVDNEPLRDQLQWKSKAELVQRVIEQADSITVIRAALDCSSQQPNQWSISYRRRLSSGP